MRPMRHNNHKRNHKRRTFSVLLGALALSLLAHVSALLLVPGLSLLSYQPQTARYSAKLIENAKPAPIVAAAPPAVPVPRPKPKAVPPVVVAAAVAEPVAVIQRPSPPRRASARVVEPTPTPVPVPEPEKVAMAAPTSSESSRPAGKPVATLPSRIAIEYELKSNLVDGRADYVWRRDDTRYEIDGSVEANGFLATMFVGRIEQNSQGVVTESGLRPTKFSLKRGETTAETADFQWAAKKIRHQRTRSEHVQDLTDNSQDLLSFIFQFAYEFPEKLNAPGRVTFSITNARKLDKYEFRIVGDEKLTLPMGPANTVHLIRQTGDPTETYEAWLDRDRHFLPVKLRFMLGGRVQVEQIAVSLNTTP